MTLKNAAYTDFSITGTRNFEEHWFTEDNNFITNDAINNSNDLSSILNDSSNSIAVDYKFNTETKFKEGDQIITTNSIKNQNK